MTEGPGTNGTPRTSTDEQRAPGQDELAGLGELERRETLAWVGEHLPQVRRSISGQRLLYWSLGIGFVVGLAAHVGGYLLRSSATTEPLGLVADSWRTLPTFSSRARRAGPQSGTLSGRIPWSSPRRSFRTTHRICGSTESGNG